MTDLGLTHNNTAEAGRRKEKGKGDESEFADDGKAVTQGEDDA